jgi:hypothetical protein
MYRSLRKRFNKFIVFLKFIFALLFSKKSFYEKLESKFISLVFALLFPKVFLTILFPKKYFFPKVFLTILFPKSIFFLKSILISVFFQNYFLCL